VRALPLTNLRFYSDAEDRVVHAAIESAVGECMRARGFQYPAREFVARPLDTVLDYPFGPWTQEEIQDGGYDFLPHPEPDASLDEYLVTLSQSELDAWSDAFVGVQGEPLEAELPDGRTVESGFRSADGCNYEAASAIFGDYADYEAMRQELDRLREAAWDEARAHPAIERALDEWRVCMGDLGYQYDSPNAPLAEFVGQDGEEHVHAETEPAPHDHDDAAPTEAEMRVSEADVGCKEEVGLHDIWYGLKQAAEQRSLEEEPEIIEGWRSVRADALAIAQAAVDDGE